MRSESDLWERLARFRSTHPLKQTSITGVQWEYLSCGQGEQALLVLPGGVGQPELGFLQITTLESKYRVISPRYPAVNTITTCVDGIAKILAAEHVARAHVLGGSFGGIIAQGFARRHPNKVGKLILSHTLAPSAGHARKTDKSLWIVSVLPIWLLRWGLRRKFRRALPSTTEASIRSFFNSYLDEKIATLSKEDLRSRMEIVADFARRCATEPAESFEWAKRVLILEGENDRMVAASEREKLKQLYPAAQVHTFRGAGHAAALVKPKEYLTVIKRFLAD